MSIMAKYAQIMWAEPSNEDVLARNKAVETLRAQISSMPTHEAIAIAEAITTSFGGGELPADLGRMVEAAISAESAAFILQGKEQQALVCLAVAALATVKKPLSNDAGWTTADALAASLWSALTLQDQVDHAKTEELRQDVIEASRGRVGLIAKAARKRVEVPDVGTLTISESDPAGGRANAAYKKATAPVIGALKTNQEFDREEVDFLWWVIADYSDALDCALGDRELFTRAVAGGLEAATMLRALPGDGFRHAVLRQVGASKRITLAALIASLAEWRAKLRELHADGWAKDFPLVFPLIASLVSDEHMPATTVELDARGWGARALLEASMVAMEDRVTGAA